MDKLDFIRENFKKGSDALIVDRFNPKHWIIGTIRENNEVYLDIEGIIFWSSGEKSVRTIKIEISNIFYDVYKIAKEY